MVFFLFVVDLNFLVGLFHTSTLSHTHSQHKNSVSLAPFRLCADSKSLKSRIFRRESFESLRCSNVLFVFRFTLVSVRFFLSISATWIIFWFCVILLFSFVRVHMPVLCTTHSLSHTHSHNIHTHTYWRLCVCICLNLCVCVNVCLPVWWGHTVCCLRMV